MPWPGIQIGKVQCPPSSTAPVRPGGQVSPLGRRDDPSSRNCESRKAGTATILAGHSTFSPVRRVARRTLSLARNGPAVPPPPLIRAPLFATRHSAPGPPSAASCLLASLPSCLLPPNRQSTRRPSNLLQRNSLRPNSLIHNHLRRPDRSAPPVSPNTPRVIPVEGQAPGRPRLPHSLFDTCP